jgi:hypothetical protein
MVQPFASFFAVMIPPGQNEGEGDDSTGQVGGGGGGGAAAMQQATPMPPPQECVLAGANVPFVHDTGERPTHSPPFASHCVVQS